MIDRAFAQRSLDALLRRDLRKRGTPRRRATARGAGRAGPHDSARTTHNTELGLLGIVDDKQGSVMLNNVGDDGLADAVENLWAVASGSRADPPTTSLRRSRRMCSRPALRRRTSIVLRTRCRDADHAKTRYPTLKMGTMRSRSRRAVAIPEPNGVDFTRRAAPITRA